MTAARCGPVRVVVISRVSRTQPVPMARRQGPSAFAPLSGTPRLAAMLHQIAHRLGDERRFLSVGKIIIMQDRKVFFYCLALSFAPLTGATARAIPVPNGAGDHRAARTPPWRGAVRSWSPREGEGGDEVGFSTYYDGPDSLSLRDNSASLDGS